MRGQDSKVVKEHYILKGRVRLARNVCSVVAGILLAVVLIGLSGCATAPQGEGTTQGFHGPETRSQDLKEQDDALVEFCQSWAIQVVSSEVKVMLAEGVDPKHITEQMVIDGIGRAYDHCIRVNGRGA